MILKALSAGLWPPPRRPCGEAAAGGEWASLLRVVHLLSQVILASGYYAAFRVTLAAKDLEGVYDGAVHITTDYEVGRRGDASCAAGTLPGER